MKKIISLCLAMILIFGCLTVTGFAADEAEVPVAEEIVIPEISQNDEELEKIQSAATELVTYIYNYATQPQEPAVDLETVLMITSVIISIIYTIYINQQTQQTA